MDNVVDFIVKNPNDMQAIRRETPPKTVER